MGNYYAFICKLDKKRKHMKKIGLILIIFVQFITYSNGQNESQSDHDFVSLIQKIVLKTPIKDLLKEYNFKPEDLEVDTLKYNYFICIENTPIKDSSCIKYTTNGFFDFLQKENVFYFCPVKDLFYLYIYNYLYIESYSIKKDYSEFKFTLINHPSCKEDTYEEYNIIVRLKRNLWNNWKIKRCEIVQQ